MRRNIIFASLLVLFVTTIIWVISAFIQPRISTVISNQILLYILILAATVSILAGFKDIYELVQMFFTDVHSRRTVAALSSPGDNQNEEWDVFISYASEDRDLVATPLARELSKRNIKVWYDQTELKIGDSLFSAISKGLLESRHGIVILSPAFFQKEWPQRELRGLFNKSHTLDNRGLVLPIWYKMGARDIENFSPILSDVVALRWEDGIEQVVMGIVRRLNSENYTPLHSSELHLSSQIRHYLAQDDYLTKIQNLITDETSQYIYTILNDVASSAEATSLMRSRSLQVLGENFQLSSEDINKLIKIPDTSSLLEILRFTNKLVTSGHKVTIPLDTLDDLFKNSNTDVVAAAVRVTSSLSSIGEVPLSFLTKVNKHPYFLVRRIAIDHLTTYEPDESLELIAQFKDTSYHLSQEKIRSYIKSNLEKGKFSAQQIERCKDILHGLSNAKNASEISKRKNSRLMKEINEYTVK